MHDTKHRPTYLYVLFFSLPVQPIYQDRTLLSALVEDNWVIEST